MSRSAYIARTAHDLEHVNKLHAPSYRLLALYLEAGDQKSKTHFPIGTTPPKDEPNNGVDNFNFAPGPQLKEDDWVVDPDKTDKIKIQYKLDNPNACITKATIEIFHRFKEKATWKKEIDKAEDLTDGEHTVKFVEEGAEVEEWDGKIEDSEKKSFPDDFLSAEHSPYKLRMVLEGEGFSRGGTAWTFFHLLIGKLELEYGPKETQPKTEAGKACHRKTLQWLIDQNEKPPSGGKAKVFLESNLFKKDHSMFDNSLFTEYEKLWGDGPQIPLLAKVWVKDSTGADVLAPRALGKLKFLWDWECKTATTGNNFADQALNYDKENTKPKGINCHKDRGGKRGNDGKPVFPIQDGYDPRDALEDGKFPFKVEACPDPRKWSAISYAWTDKKLAAKTGVMFQPARTAGDAYSVTLAVAYDADKDGKLALNTDKDPPLLVQDQLKVTAGEFEIWRKQYLRKYLKKKGTVPSLTIASIIASYESSFVDLEDVSGGSSTMAAGDWNTAVTDAISGWSEVNKLFLDTGANQYTVSNDGAYFRSRPGFTHAWMKLKLEGLGMSSAQANTVAGAGLSSTANGKTSASHLGYSSAAWQTTVEGKLDSVKTYMANPANGYNTNRKYADKMEDKCIEILYAVFDGQFAAEDGVHIFQTEKTHNLRHHQNGYTLGIAHDFDSATDRKCGFLLMCKSNDVPCGTEKISAHEIGHHFCLPHPFGTTPSEPDYLAHDDGVNSCLMSYNYATVMELCGFCQLRLRGWDKSKLDPDGSKNSKI